MANVMTKTATIQCPHGFPIASTKSEPLLTIGDDEVLTSDTLMPDFTKCTATAQQVKCTAVATDTTVSLLEVNGSPVVVDTAMTTNSTIAGGKCTLLVIPPVLATAEQA